MTDYDALVERAEAARTALLNDRPYASGVIADLLAAIRTLREERDGLRHDNDMLTRGGIIEVAVRNPSVADYMTHWEGRAETAEAALAELRSRTLSKDDER